MNPLLTATKGISDYDDLAASKKRTRPLDSLKFEGDRHLVTRQIKNVRKLTRKRAVGDDENAPKSYISDTAGFSTTAGSQ